MSVSVLPAVRGLGRVLPRDRVWLVFAVLLALVALASPPRAVDTLLFVAGSLIEIAPYLLVAVLLAAYAQASGSDALIARALDGRAALAVPFAALVGALAPFCSCGVVPLIAALLAMGVPLAPVMAFWLSSPIIDPPTFVLTLSILGLPFAVGKTVAAFLLGLLGGWAIRLFAHAQWVARPMRAELAAARRCGSCCAGPPQIEFAVWRDRQRLRRFASDALADAALLVRWLALAFLLESLMLTLVPAEFVAGLVGEGGWLPVVLATIVGVPAYLNGYAALPVVAGLLEQGMAPGAAMAFLVAGGVSCIPAAVAVWAIARPPVFAAYLAFAFVGAMLAGLGFGAVWAVLPASW